MFSPPLLKVRSRGQGEVPAANARRPGSAGRVVATAHSTSLSGRSLHHDRKNLRRRRRLHFRAGCAAASL